LGDSHGREEEMETHVSRLVGGRRCGGEPPLDPQEDVDDEQEGERNRKRQSGRDDVRVVDDAPQRPCGPARLEVLAEDAMGLYRTQWCTRDNEKSARMTWRVRALSVSHGYAP
jgi:hypothetical protein